MSSDSDNRDYYQKIYELYVTERRELNNFQFQQSLSYDKTAIVISGGALGLSLTFIKDVIGAHEPSMTYLLWCGWGMLVLAIFCTLSSFLLSVRAYQRQREILDFEYAKPDEKFDNPNCWTHRVELANRISLVSIVLGVGLLTIFVSTNAWSSKMAVRGAPPPTSPSMPRPTPGAGSPPATNPAPPPPPPTRK